MKIGLIGNIVLDEIRTFNGNVTKSWGGAFYSYATFQKLLKEGETLLPATPVGYDIWGNLMLDLAVMDRIDTSALYRSELPNNKVILRYINKNEREERAKDILPPIEFENLRPIMKTDAILVSFISGFELSLSVLRELRENYEGIMLLDIHTLLLGIDKDGIRFSQALPEWRDWISNFDCVQMNSAEAEILMRNRWLMMFIHYRARTLIVLSPALILYELASLGVAVLRGWAGQTLRAWRWLWVHRAEIRERRVRMAAARKIEDGELLTGGPIPFAPGFLGSGWQRVAARTLSRVLDGYWRVARRWLRS